MRQSTLRFEALDVAVRTWHSPDANPDARRLLCFPFSGGGSTAFKSLAVALGGDWQVHAVNPPGHGLGAQQQCKTSVSALVDTYLACLPPDLLDDAVVLGYSLGAYVAHHLVVALHARPDGPRPRGLVVCSAPPYDRRGKRYSDLPDDDLFTVLTKLGGIPTSLERASGAFALFSHVVRADFQAYEGCAAPTGALDVPTLVVAGDADPIFPPEWAGEWRRYLPNLATQTVRGSHVYLPDNSTGLAAALERWAGALPAPRGPAKGPLHAT